jgi:hypothetical protein
MCPGILVGVLVFVIVGALHPVSMTAASNSIPINILIFIEVLSVSKISLKS